MISDSSITATFINSDVAGARRIPFTGKRNGFPFLDILGYLKNTHKNPKFGKETSPNQVIPNQVPWLGLVSLFKIWNFCRYSLNSLKYPKMGIGYFFLWLLTWIISISDLSGPVSNESTISVLLSFWRSEPTSSASILLHLSILIVLSPPVKPSCDWFGARETVNLTLLPMCLVLAWASWYSQRCLFYIRKR